MLEIKEPLECQPPSSTLLPTSDKIIPSPMNAVAYGIKNGVLKKHIWDFFPYVSPCGFAGGMMEVPEEEGGGGGVGH